MQISIVVEIQRPVLVTGLFRKKQNFKYKNTPDGGMQQAPTGKRRIGRALLNGY